MSEDSARIHRSVVDRHAATPDWPVGVACCRFLVELLTARRVSPDHILSGGSRADRGDSSSAPSKRTALERRMDMAGMMMRTMTGAAHSSGREFVGPGARRLDRRRALGALLVGAAMLVAAPAVSAGKPSKPSGGTSSGVQYCADMTGSTTMHDVNVAIGADTFHKPTGRTAPIMGAGIDVAVIDTGVNPVGVNAVVDGPDLSFDALNTNLRNRDVHGHGTNMAGIIATNTSTAWGVAPGSRIVNVKVGAADGAVDVSQVIAGIDWVVQNRNANGMKIRVINLAYDTDAAVDYRTDPLTRAVENAWKNGIVVVVAGGNDGRGVQRLGNPALDPYVIAVGASEFVNGKWKVPSFSSTGDGVRNVDIVAPGASLVSLGVAGSYLADTHPAATCVGSDGLLYLRGSGTSQAAAVASGAVAMLLEQRPGLTPDQVKKLLTSTATDLALNTFIQGHGMLNLGAALNTSTPSLTQSAQTFPAATGTGSLDAARGSYHVGDTGDQLTGELTAFGGTWDSAAHALAQATGTAWTNQTWNGASWSGGTWSGGTWSGASWSGASWSGASWSGASWSGASWSGASWSGASWSGASWSGASWSGASWSGASWSGASWSGSDWS
jgi:serine protease AprX